MLNANMAARAGVLALACAGVAIGLASPASASPASAGVATSASASASASASTAAGAVAMPMADGRFQPNSLRPGSDWFYQYTFSSYDTCSYYGLLYVINGYASGGTCSGRYDAAGYDLWLRN